MAIQPTADRAYSLLLGPAISFSFLWHSQLFCFPQSRPSCSIDTCGVLLWFTAFAKFTSIGPLSKLCIKVPPTPKPSSAADRQAGRHLLFIFLSTFLLLSYLATQLPDLPPALPSPHPTSTFC